MKRRTLLMGSALIPSAMVAASWARPANAQGKPQTLAEVNVDVRKLATGWRASKIEGSTVYNDANESVGKIDDLIIHPDDRVLFAIVSVGGFLGVGSHMVAVPYQVLRVSQDKIVLPGATKEALKGLPEFKYAS